jgi:hypothetical protein
VGLKKLADIVESLKEFDSVTDAFCIPPDFDDSYLNLGLGATLQKLSNVYPKIYSSWLNNNTDVAHLIEVTSKYAYRPFAADINQNTIDPRTYFWSRKFIEQASQENKSLSLITTWVFLFFLITSKSIVKFVDSLLLLTYFRFKILTSKELCTRKKFQCRSI